MAKDTINTLPTNDANFITDLQTFLRDECPQRAAASSTSLVIYGGIGPTDATLAHTIPECLGFPSGWYVLQTAVSKTYTASRYTWVFLCADDASTITQAGYTVTRSGHFVFLESVADTTPTLPTACTWLAKVTTDGTSITAVSDLRHLVVVGTYTLENAITQGAAGVIEVPPGSKIDLGDFNLTIGGQFICGRQQAFVLSGSGTVTFGAGHILYPEWWYTGTGYWNTSVNYAIQNHCTVDFLGGKTYDMIGAGNFDYTNTAHHLNFSNKDHVTIEANYAEINNTGLYFADCSYISVLNFITTMETATYAYLRTMYAVNSSYVTLKDVKFFSGCTRRSFFFCYFSDHWKVDKLETGVYAGDFGHLWGMHDCTFNDCIIRGSDDDAFGIKGAAIAGLGAAGSYNITITNCIVQNCYAIVSFGTEIGAGYDVRNITVSNCVGLDTGCMAKINCYPSYAVYSGGILENVNISNCVMYSPEGIGEIDVIGHNVFAVLSIRARWNGIVRNINVSHCTAYIRMHDNYASGMEYSAVAIRCAPLTEAGATAPNTYIGDIKVTDCHFEDIYDAVDNAVPTPGYPILKQISIDSLWDAGGAAIGTIGRLTFENNYFRGAKYQGLYIYTEAHGPILGPLVLKNNVFKEICVDGVGTYIGVMLDAYTVVAKGNKVSLAATANAATFPIGPSSAHTNDITYIEGEVSEVTLGSMWKEHDLVCPSTVKILLVDPATKAAPGSLAVSQWGWGSIDLTQKQDTMYVRMTDGSDPNIAVAGTLLHRLVLNATITTDLGTGTAYKWTAASAGTAEYYLEKEYTNFPIFTARRGCYISRVDITSDEAWLVNATDYMLFSVYPKATGNYIVQTGTNALTNTALVPCPLVSAGEYVYAVNVNSTMIADEVLYLTVQLISKGVPLRNLLVTVHYVEY